MLKKSSAEAGLFCCPLTKYLSCDIYELLRKLIINLILFYMELLNFEFWQAVYSVCIGGISMLLWELLIVVNSELKRLGLFSLGWILMFLIVFNFSMLVLMLGNWLLGFKFDVILAVIGAVPMVYGVDRGALLQKLQPMFLRLRKHIYTRIVRDDSLKNILEDEADSAIFYSFIKCGLVVGHDEFLWKNNQDFHQDIQNFLNRHADLKLDYWKIEMLQECGYTFPVSVKVE